MAVQGKNSDEDYLDNLLKAVLGEKSDLSTEKNEKLNKDNLDDTDAYFGDENPDEDFLDDIDAMYDKAMEEFDDELEKEDFNLSEDEESKISDEGEVHLKTKPSKPKKEKKKLFGRKKHQTSDYINDFDLEAAINNENENHENENNYENEKETPVVEDVLTQDQMIMNELFSDEPEIIQTEDPDTLMPDMAEEEHTEEDAVYDMPMAPDFIEDVLEDHTGSSEDNESSLSSQDSLDEDMQGLYDILGVPQDEGYDNSSNNSNDDEITQLENVKGKKEKSGKKKKGLFGRKKKKADVDIEKPEDELQDVTLQDDLMLDSSETLDTPEDSFGSMDMGGLASPALDTSDGLEDIFSAGFDEHPDMDENSRLIEGMNNGEFDEDDIMSDQEDKKKKKKEKKVKKKKPKKEKPKKEKKKKVSKPKKPKQPDEIIPIPKAFLIFCFSVIVLLVVGLIIVGDYQNYTKKTDAALVHYINQDYEAAYNNLVGLDMNEDDQFFYDQLELIMYVDRHYISYKSLYELEKYDQALHTLVRGVKMYDKYYEEAVSLNCADDFVTVLSWIDKALLDKFELTESEARELYLIPDQYEYARQIYAISDKAEEREKLKKENDK